MIDGFRFKTQVRVRNFEVDWQGIVHNANYLLYFEIGRIEYLKQLGIQISMESIMGSAKIVVARNEIDYRSSARFDESLDVFTKISHIKNTSFTFEGKIIETNSDRLVADNIAVHVWFDSQSDSPVRVPDEFRKKILEFEGIIY
ncbi:MAG: acyl-CoA thioesterase [Ignavibacteriae bacterium]|nr:acyl-CoA thioesterase [Ignavibacteriota bacterium]